MLIILLNFRSYKFLPPPSYGVAKDKEEKTLSLRRPEKFIKPRFSEEDERLHLSRTQSRPQQSRNWKLGVKKTKSSPMFSKKHSKQAKTEATCGFHDKSTEPLHKEQNPINMEVVEDINKIVSNTHDGNKDMQHKATIHETESVKTEETDASPLENGIVLSVLDLPENIAKGQ